MAIINFSKKFIFVHVPKAAGTSITNLLSKFTTITDIEVGGTEFGEKVQPAYKKRFGLSKHSPASNIRDIVGLENWENMFKFSVVRDPYERTISTYKFLLKWEGTPEIYKNRMKKFKDVNEFIKSGLIFEDDGPDAIFKPQAYWLTDVNDRSKIIVDYIGKTENLNNDTQEIIKRVDAKFSSEHDGNIPRLNKTDGKLSIDEESVSIINKYYSRDFKLFGYEKK